MATRSPIEAYARLKPAERPHQQILYTVDPAEETLSIHLPKDGRKSTIANNTKETYAFNFAQVFPAEAT